MPVRWEISHPQKLVHVVIDGEVTLKQMEEHFDALVVANALGYRKLVDATSARPLYDNDDVMTMGARLSAYTASFPSGPLAVVSVTSAVQAAFRRFVNISPSKRPARLFKTEAEARAWLAEQPLP
jgi:SpoIIAA-like